MGQYISQWLFVVLPPNLPSAMSNHNNCKDQLGILQVLFVGDNSGWLELILNVFVLSWISLFDIVHKLYL